MRIDAIRRSDKSPIACFGGRYGNPGREIDVRVKVFTARSVVIGVASGVLVSAVLGPLVGASRGLAILNGLVAGAGALALAGCLLRDGRFSFMSATASQRRIGVWMLAWLSMSSAMFFVRSAIGDDLSSPADRLALSLLFGFTGFTSYAFGGIMATLEHLDGDDAADPRLHRMTPPSGE